MSDIKAHQTVLIELLKEFDKICRNNNIPYVVFGGTALGAVRHGTIIPWDDDIDVSMLRKDYEQFLKIAASELDEKYYLQSEFSSHWPMAYSKLRKNKTTCLEKYHPLDKKTHQGIYIDIFPCDNAAERTWKRKAQFYLSRIILAKTLSKRGYDTDSKSKKLFMLLSKAFPLKPLCKIVKLEKNSNSEYVQTFISCTSKYNKGIYKRKWYTETIEMSLNGISVPVSAHYDEFLSTLYGDYMTLPTEEERKYKVHALLVDTERDYTEYENYRDNIKFDVYTRNIH